MCNQKCSDSGSDSKESGRWYLFPFINFRLAHYLHVVSDVEHTAQQTHLWWYWSQRQNDACSIDHTHEILKSVAAGTVFTFPASVIASFTFKLF